MRDTMGKVQLAVDKRGAFPTERPMAVSYLLGDDIFISYARLDATPYTAGLASLLASKGFAVRVDQWGSVPAPSVPRYLLNVVRNSCVFVLVASAAARHSSAIEQEIKAFLPTKRPIILIDLDGSVSEAKWWPLVRGLHVSHDNDSSTKAGIPSEAVTKKIINSFTFKRKEQRQRLATVWAVSALIILTTVATWAGIYASQKIREAATADRQRRQSAKEAEQQKSNATAARLETSRQQKLASEAEQRAATARDEQHRAERQTQEAVATRMQSDGSLYLDSRPDISVNLAFSAAQISSSMRIASLLRTSADRIPMWFEHVPHGTKRDSFMLFSSDPTDHDAIAADVEMNTLLVHSTVDQKAVMSLYAVPDHKELSRLQLRKGWTLETPETIGSDLIAVDQGDSEHQKGAVAIYDLTSRKLDAPLMTLGDTKQVQFTNGTWPAYSLSTTGDLISHGKPGSKGHIGAGEILGRWSDALTISVFPDPGQPEVAILNANSVTFVSRKQGSFDQHRVFLQGHPMASACRVYWGPSSFQALLTCLEYGQIVVYGVDARSDVAEPLYTATTERNPLFTASSDGRRFAILMQTKESKQSIIVVDVEWKNDSSDLRPKLHPYSSDLLAYGNHRANTFGIVNCIALSPHGTVLVLGSELVGVSGATNAIGQLEIWDLSPLGQKTDISPTSTVLNKGDGSPITRIAFSGNGTRLLAWDANDVTTIFQINTDPNRKLLRGLAPAVISRLSPEITAFGDGGRFRRVSFGDGELDNIDALTGLTFDLQSFAPDAQIFDYAVSTSPEDLTLATSHGVLRVNHRHVMKRKDAPELAVNGSVSDGIAMLQTTHSLLIYDSETLKSLGLCPLSSDFKPDWIWAQKVRPGWVWVYAVEFKKAIVIRAWHFEPESGLQQARTPLHQIEIRLDDLKDNEAVNWFFSDGRAFLQLTKDAVIDSAIFLASNADAASEIRLYDLTSGHRLPLVPPAGRGWPTGSRSMMELLKSHSGEFTLLLRYFEKASKNYNVLAATWERDGGTTHKTILLQGDGEVVYTEAGPNPGDHLIMFRGEDRLTLVRTRDGKREWEGVNEDYLRFPPALIRLASGKWEAQDTETYRKTRLRVFMGGEKSSARFTSVPLPSEILSSYTDVSRARETSGSK